jgi:shikimate dehydrogenase
MTVRGAVLGSPIEHSLSPLLHREAFKFLGIEGSYERVLVEKGELKNFFTKNSANYDYFSITMPLKEEALDLEVIVDESARRVQSANTLYKSQGQWHLTTTDGVGFVAALKAAGYSSFRSVLILGAGGTARALVGSLDAIAEKITILGRTSTRREVLEQAVVKSEFEYQRWNENPGFQNYDLVINTTPAGAADLLADSLFDRECALLFDVIYKPWPTVLAARWSDSGGTVINGSEMLLFQGIAQLELVLGRDLDQISLASHLRPLLQAAL